MNPTDVQGEDLTWIWPRDRGRHPDRSVTDQETAENKCVAEEKDPHHGLSPGSFLKRALVRGPVGDYTRCAVKQRCRLGHGGLRRLRHVFFFSLSDQQQTEHHQPDHQQEVPVHSTQFHAHVNLGHLSTTPQPDGGSKPSNETAQ